MLKMGGLKKYMPVTFWTMMIGTLAIAGIPPLAGFFSKDEILLQAFLGEQAGLGARGVRRADDRVLHVPADVADLLRRLPRAGVGDGGARARRGAAPCRRTAAAAPARDAGDAGHGGHGAWHGPHESPKPMTFALVVLAVGAVLAGFVGVPAALGGGNAIEHFLDPSFAAPRWRPRGRRDGGRAVEQRGGIGRGRGGGRGRGARGAGSRAGRARGGPPAHVARRRDWR